MRDIYRLDTVMQYANSYDNIKELFKKIEAIGNVCSIHGIKIKQKINKDFIKPILDFMIRYHKEEDFIRLLRTRKFLPMRTTNIETIVFHNTRQLLTLKNMVSPTIYTIILAEYFRKHYIHGTFDSSNYWIVCDDWQVVDFMDGPNDQRYDINSYCNDCIEIIRNNIQSFLNTGIFEINQRYLENMTQSLDTMCKNIINGQTLQYFAECIVANNILPKLTQQEQKTILVCKNTGGYNMIIEAEELSFVSSYYQNKEIEDYMEAI